MHTGWLLGNTRRQLSRERTSLQPDCNGNCNISNNCCITDPNALVAAVQSRIRAAPDRQAVTHGIAHQRYSIHKKRHRQPSNAVAESVKKVSVENQETVCGCDLLHKVDIEESSLLCKQQKLSSSTLVPVTVVCTCSMQTDTRTHLRRERFLSLALDPVAGLMNRSESLSSLDQEKCPSSLMCSCSANRRILLRKSS